MTIANSTIIRRAATYIRMSTERQVYSPDNQRAKLEEYARQFGWTIVAEYIDGGKSGLSIKCRPDLSRLLGDVLSGVADFTAILVYDVSRWGRFQDVDESAHYEYLCRSAGVDVIYCAELFANDGSPMSAILKGIRRSMAAEYSRELSAKVFAAQCRFVSLGFKQGGSAGYGLRRAVVGVDGHIKRILAFGDRKGTTADRVIFVLGPPEEIKVVRQVYTWYLEERLGETAIAARLNASGVPSEFARPWTPWLVHSLLTNEKFIGNHVFNRGSFKLKRAAIHNPPELWIRKDMAFEAPVTPEMFRRAGEERVRRSKKLTSNAMLDLVRQVHAKHGRVTAKLLTVAHNSTLPKLLARQFGSMTAAYGLAGIPCGDQYRNLSTRTFVRLTKCAMCAQAIELIVGAGGTANVEPGGRTIEVNSSIIVHIEVSRSRHDPAGHVRWKIRVPQRADFVLAAQLDRQNKNVGCYFLLATPEFRNTATLTLREERPDEFAQYRYAEFSAVFGVPPRCATNVNRGN